MPLPLALMPGLRLPALAAPMFLTSGVDLVVECSRAGVLGSFPALNTRSTEGLGDWLEDFLDEFCETMQVPMARIAVHEEARVAVRLEFLAGEVPMLDRPAQVTPEGLDVMAPLMGHHEDRPGQPVWPQ